METLHELIPRQVSEHGSLSANRLRDQEALRLGMVKTGRVELDHFHVPERTSGSSRHRDPVRGGDVGVGRIPVDLSTASSGEHRVLGSNQPGGSGLLVEKRRAVTPAACLSRAYPKIEGEVLLEHRDFGVLRHGGEQCTLDLLPRAILRMHDSSSAVPPLQTQIETLGIAVPVSKRGAQLGETSNESRPFPYHGLHHIPSAQARPRLEGVGYVQVERVGGTQNRREPALRAVGRGVAPALLGQNEDGTELRRPKRIGQASHPTTRVVQ